MIENAVIVVCLIITFIAGFTLCYALAREQVVKAKKENGQLYSYALMEHKRLHGCTGGLGLTEEGRVIHFAKPD